MTKLEFLRAQAAAYLRDAEAQTEAAETERLAILPLRCHEMIVALEESAAGKMSAAD